MLPNQDPVATSIYKDFGLENGLLAAGVNWRIDQDCGRQAGYSAPVHGSTVTQPGKCRMFRVGIFIPMLLAIAPIKESSYGMGWLRASAISRPHSVAAASSKTKIAPL